MRIQYCINLYVCKVTFLLKSIISLMLIFGVAYQNVIIASYYATVDIPCAMDRKLVSTPSFMPLLIILE